MRTEASSPKYSIVVPTRNREKYLPYAVESVLSSNRADVELIVSNNHSLDGTDRYLSSLSDPRLKVLRPSEELPMSKHYEFALSHATGEWVTILGDDDAIMPYLFDRLDLLTARYPEVSIISSERAYYFWEGCEDLYGDSVVVYFRGPGKVLRSTARDLLCALAGMRSCFDLPQIYTSCMVKTSLVTRIRERSGGRFYHSIIPDMYSAVSLTLAEEAYLRIEEPLFWTGTSNRSMGRSDRIYRDSELKGRAGENGLPPLRLHDAIPEELHMLGVGSLYLYEALLNCPLSKGLWKKRQIAHLVYAALLKKVQKESSGPGSDGAGLKKKIYEQIEEDGLPLWQVKATMFLVSGLQIIQQIFSIPKRVLRKARRLIRNDSLVSNDRERFSTILTASRAIEDLSR